MTNEISTSIRIQANPLKVWEIFSDFKSYPSWNSFITSLTGEPLPHGRITVRIQPPGAAGMTFKPQILKHEAGRELRWRGVMLLPGIFDGEHTFRLEENPDGSTTFTQSEKFSGLLVPLFKKMIENNTLRGFEKMNEELKKRAEQG